MKYRAGLVPLLVVCSLFAAGPVVQKGVIAPHQVDAGHRHVRMLAVVPLIGTGRNGDYIRPSYVPMPPNPGANPDPNGIIGFTAQISDDGKHALVELVARDRSAFKQLMADTRPDVKVFEKGKATRAVIEAEFRRWKSDFNLDQMAVRVP